MTIERTEVEGRPAIVIHLNDNFEPVDKAAATMIKVRFLDAEGGIMFGVRTPKDKDQDDE